MIKKLFKPFRWIFGIEPFDKLYWCPTCNEWFNRYHKYDDLISEGELVTDDDWIALNKEMEGE